VWFVAQGIWGFNKMYLLGLSLAGLPLEEILFFFAIPYACLFVYLLVKEKARLNSGLLTDVISWLLLLGALGGMVIFQDHTYSSFNFFVLALLLLFHLRFVRANYLSNFYLAHLILLVPFLFVNGILTNGLGQGPVVWYSPDAFMGVRLLGIPLDDFFYSLSLQLANVLVYEWLMARHISPEQAVAED
jgi:lycopene cyclase domain-containing protein